MTEALQASGLLRRAVACLGAAGVPSPEHDARELLALSMGVSRSRLTPSTDVDPDSAARFEAFIARRAAREPLQHLTGRTGFRFLDLAVGPGVFVPRPETEVLTGWVVDQVVQVAGAGRRPVVVDLCTGSGAIALAVAREAPGADVHAVELGEQAYEWARRNCSGSRVDLRHGDMVDAFPDLDGTVDVVVCNPPYIPLEAFESVAPEARDHDPALALWSGQDGLEAIRVVERVAARLLRSAGVVGVEHADVQGESAPAVFWGSGRWTDVRDHRDLAGRPRFVTARLAR